MPTDDFHTIHIIHPKIYERIGLVKLQPYLISMFSIVHMHHDPPQGLRTLCSYGARNHKLHPPMAWWCFTFPKSRHGA